jgi:hypothetical protein
VTPADIERISEAAAKTAVHETLRVLGIDVSRPFEVQKDMAHLRAWRISMESMQLKGLLVAVSIAISGVAAAVWAGIKWH